jgi:hypothetical protein
MSGGVVSEDAAHESLIGAIETAHVGTGQCAQFLAVE